VTAWPFYAARGLLITATAAALIVVLFKGNTPAGHCGREEAARIFDHAAAAV
jgi:hypothetical protein